MTVLQKEVHLALAGLDANVHPQILFYAFATEYFCSLDIPLAEGMLEMIVFSANQSHGPCQVAVGVSHVILLINYTDSCSSKIFV